MTGLDASVERLLEVACIITNENLEPLDEGVSYVIKTDKSVLDQMGEWCVSVEERVSVLTRKPADACAPRHTRPTSMDE